MSDINKLTEVIHDEVDDDQMDLEEPTIELPPHLQHQQQDDTLTPTSNTLLSSSQIPPTTASNLSTDDIVGPEPNEPRPGCLFLNGVDELDTRAIKLYIDSILKPDKNFKNHEQYTRYDYKLEWINDESINIIFYQPDVAIDALSSLSEESSIGSEMPSTEIRPAKQYNVSDPLVNTENIKLSIRQSLYGDKKVKNASNYSRYYLIHGEPEAIQRAPYSTQRRRNNGSSGNSSWKNEYTDADFENPDLITGDKPELPDILSSEHNPDRPSGLFGFDADKDERAFKQKKSYYSQKNHLDEGRWTSDKYYTVGDETNDRKDRFFENRYNNNRRNRGYSRGSGRNRGYNRGGRERRSRSHRDDEGDLFPNFEKRDRDRSPTRMQEE